MHFLSFISVISQNETDYHNVTFWENSSEEGSWVGWDQPDVSCCFFGRSLLALQKGWWSCSCTCVKIHLGTEVQYCGWRHIDKKALGWFGFFPFCFLLVLGWGVKFSRHSHSRLLPCVRLCTHTDPKPVCTSAGGECCQNVLIASASPASGLCPCGAGSGNIVQFVCGAAASTRERTVSPELKCCFLLDAVWGFFKIKIWNTVRRMCVLVSVVGEHPALSENNFQFSAL